MCFQGLQEASGGAQNGSRTALGTKGRSGGPKLRHIGPSRGTERDFGSHVEVPRAAGTHRNSRNSSRGKSQDCLSIHTWVSTSIHIIFMFFVVAFISVFP